MRHIIILDNAISTKNYEEWKLQDIAFWKKYFQIEPQYFVQRHDFSTYPTFVDSDGDRRPTHSYLVDLATDVTQGYGQYGADFIIMAVHEDNFVSDNPKPGVGIWGTNYSNIVGSYCLQYCRWDKDNVANTFGTLYHERAHSFDAIVKNELGKDINDVAGTVNWDREMVHGNSPRYEYIRWKENTDALQLVQALMHAAFLNRIRMHVKFIQGRISIFEKILRWFREWKNRTDGVPRGKIG